MNHRRWVPVFTNLFCFLEDRLEPTTIIIIVNEGLIKEEFAKYNKGMAVPFHSSFYNNNLL